MPRPDLAGHTAHSRFYERTSDSIPVMRRLAVALVAVLVALPGALLARPAESRSALLAARAAPTHRTVPPAGTDCRLFPRNNHWHADVRDLPRHPKSDEWIRAMGGPDQLLHPDFGPSDGEQPYGIPYDVVDSSHDKVDVDFYYPDESDPGPYPFGPDITIEGGSDRHALMLHDDECALYELYDADWNGGEPTAGSGAIWNIGSNRLRPAGWTSADAAGLAILPGLIRRNEVEAGRIDHAIRVTAEQTDHRYIWPARHRAGADDDPNLPPMGAWFRMKSGFPIGGYLEETQVILRAFKVHGMIVADNGSNWFFGGASEEGWTSEVLDELKSIPARAFVAVRSEKMMVGPNSGRVKPRYVGG